MHSLLTIREKLQRNVYDKKTQEGYLTTHKIKEYLACFPKIDINCLEKLLNDDLQYWKENHKVLMKSEADKISRIQQILDE